MAAKTSLRISVEFDDAEGDFKFAVLTPEDAIDLRDTLTAALERTVEEQ